MLDTLDLPVARDVPTVTGLLCRSTVHAPGRLLGYELRTDSGWPAQVDVPATFAASEIEGSEPRPGDPLCFVVEPGGFDAWDALSPVTRGRLVPVVDAQRLSDRTFVGEVARRVKAGQSMCLDISCSVKLPMECLSPSVFVRLSGRRFDAAGLRDICAAVRKTHAQPFIVDVDGEDLLAECWRAGAAAVAGHAHADPPVKPKGLSPEQGTIVTLMRMVRSDEEMTKIEAALRRDAGLAFKLLSYINTPRFGMGVRIESLAHALQVLGYEEMYRWLGMLLVRSAQIEATASLTQTALIRAYFAEALAKQVLPEDEAANLFIVGLFSVLDRMTGMAMPELLRTVRLSDEIAGALLYRSEPYGRFLRIAESCETDGAEAAQMATALFLTAAQIDEAHVGAIQLTTATAF